VRPTKRRNADGSEVRYCQLAENIWDAARGCAVAKVVYNFGRADPLDLDGLRRTRRPSKGNLPGGAGSAGTTADPSHREPVTVGVPWYAGATTHGALPVTATTHNRITS
jgi:hypothetical protein